MLGGVIASGHRVLAQSNIVPDATLGAESSVVVPNFRGLPVEAIEGGAQRGQNLFHSFQEFNVSEGRGAYFYSPDAAIGNILARVTGGNPSEILGVLGTFGNSGLNLFLINPNGIIFGRNASLDVGGSFVASTANSVVFDNGYQFSATNPQAPPLLTVNVPLGLQFGANPGRIVSQSVVGLAVQPGRTLALVGGEVALESGILFTSDGQIELGSVAGNSQVNLTPNSTGYTLGYEGVENFQDIRLTQGAFVLTNTNVGGGSIQVQGRNVTLTDGSIILTDTYGAGKGGNLIVNASDSVQVIGTSADGRTSALGAMAGSTATGDAGELRITTPTLLVLDGAQVTTSTLGAGKGGSLIVNASDSVQLIGTSAKTISSLIANTSGTGDAGQVRITTRQLLISDGANISASTLGTGKGGSVIIDASQGVQVIGTGTSAKGQVSSLLAAATLGTGDAGELRINTRQLLISDGASISTRTFDAGKGGNVIVNASEGVQVIGRSADGKLGSDISANTFGTGDAGNLTITTPVLLVRDGAGVSASTLGAGKGGSLIINASDWVQLVDGDLSAFTSGTGDGGEMRITTGQLLVRDGAGITASTLGAGKGGSLVVNASDWVQLVGGDLSAFTSGTGDGGEIRITTGQLLLKDGAAIFADTFGAGKGGSLTLDASEGVQVIGESADGRFYSQLSTSTLGTGDGGEIRITTGQLLVRDGAGIFTGTIGAGKAGNLTVNASESVHVIGTSADGRFPSGLFVNAVAGSTAGDLSVETRQMSVRDGARVTVSSPSGQAGNLTITANSLSLNRGTILAETGQSTAEGGANITLQGLDLLRMDNESLISASALEDANGGNVTIDSTFIVATPPKGPRGSDITANAFRGNGGRVSIITQGLFGIEFRPKLTPNNDITASSEFGIAGEVAINSPDVDPSRGLAELPTDVVDASEQIDRRCTPAGRTAQRSSFTITGRGGLPPSPNDVLQGESVIVNWVTLDPQTDNRSSNDTPAATTAPQTPTLTEAQGWMYGSNGEVILTAEASNVTPQSPIVMPVTCPALD
jgi:filamentous hemagglutinin family protein